MHQLVANAHSYSLKGIIEKQACRGQQGTKDSQQNVDKQVPILILFTSNTFPNHLFQLLEDSYFQVIHNPLASGSLFNRRQT
jgi:hypothetical protein